MKLCISLPTRGRPEKLIANIKRSTSNLVLDNTVMMVQVDDDDRPTIDALSTAELGRHVKVNIKPREDTIAAKWNRALSEPADVYLVDADDAPWITPGYDGRILEAAKLFPDAIGMVYGHMANLSFSGVLAPTAKFCDKLGYIFPEYFPYWFVDHWVDDICRHIGRVSFADVRTDQSNVGVTQEMREPSWWATWYDATYLKRLAIAHAIIDSIDFKMDPGLKAAKLSLPPSVAGARIDNWSRYVNSEVRGMKGSSSLSLQDPRYQRVKQKAIDMLPGILAELPPAEAKAYGNYLLPLTNVVGLQRAFA